MNVKKRKKTCATKPLFTLLSSQKPACQEKNAQ